MKLLNSAVVLAAFLPAAAAQDPTLGVIADPLRAAPGYTLLASQHYGNTYLIESGERRNGRIR